MRPKQAPATANKILTARNVLIKGITKQAIAIIAKAINMDLLYPTLEMNEANKKEAKARLTSLNISITEAEDSKTPK